MEKISGRYMWTHVYLPFVFLYNLNIKNSQKMSNVVCCAENVIQLTEKV